MRRNTPNNIRSLREQKIPAWSQEELARLVGCSGSEISKYERGERLPLLPMAIRIAQALGVPVQELFWGLRDVSLVALYERRGQLLALETPPRAEQKQDEEVALTGVE